MRPFVTDLTDTFAAIARSKRLQFVANVAPDVPAVVMADDLRLQQALGNLLGAPFSFLSPPSPQNQRPRRVARRCKDGHVLTNAGCIGLKPREGGGGGRRHSCSPGNAFKFTASGRIELAVWVARGPTAALPALLAAVRTWRLKVIGFCPSCCGLPTAAAKGVRGGWVGGWTGQRAYPPIDYHAPPPCARARRRPSPPLV